MTIKNKDIKILWGRSGNRCAICRTELTQDAAAISAAYTLGEQAHIVGEKNDAPRGQSVLEPNERDGYHNLILLCPNHHTQIDRNEADWPIERLHQTKSEHELWVTETLSETIDHVNLANQASLSSLIDSTVESCDLENWQAWTSFALSPDQSWSKDRLDAIWNFRQKVIGAIWPDGYDEMRRATITFSVLIHTAAQKFLEHANVRENVYITDRYYQRPDFNPNYDNQIKEFEEWQSQCDLLLHDATKAANWFADVVRREVNPFFFATKGKFLVLEGPFMDMSFRSSLLEFTEEERARLPATLNEPV